jgi:hypothetical protein
VDPNGRDQLLAAYEVALAGYADAVEGLKAKQSTMPQDAYKLLLQSVRIAKRKCDLLHLALERESEE